MFDPLSNKLYNALTVSSPLSIDTRLFNVRDLSTVGSTFNDDARSTQQLSLSDA